MQKRALLKIRIEISKNKHRSCVSNFNKMQCDAMSHAEKRVITVTKIMACGPLCDLSSLGCKVCKPSFLPLRQYFKVQSKV